MCVLLNPNFISELLRVISNQYSNDNSGIYI